MSALSYYDQFTAIDWERYSVLTGKVSCVAAIVISIVSMIMKYDVGVGIYTLIMGFLIALWEMPMFFCGMKQAEDCKTFFLENLYIKNDLVRSVLYIGLSIFMFMRKTLCIAAGIMLVLAALLLIFAAINKHSDARDSAGTGSESDIERSRTSTPYVSTTMPSSAIPAQTTLIGEKNKFGTF